MKRAATLVLLGLIAGACRIDVDLRAALGPDGSGDLEFNVTTDAEFETLFRLTGQEFEEFVVLRGQEIGLSFDVTEGADTVYHSSAQSIPAESIEFATGHPGTARGSQEDPQRRNRSRRGTDRQTGNLAEFGPWTGGGRSPLATNRRVCASPSW